MAAHGARPVLIVIGWLCLVAGLVPSYWGTYGTTGFNLGLWSSPVFRSYRKVIESPRSVTTLEDGSTVQSSWSSSTVYEWEIHVFSWSMALVAVGAVLIVAALRSRADRGPSG